jgi:hypothetical protein
MSTADRRAFARCSAIALLGLALSAFPSCDREASQVQEPICRVNQFRLCPADCRAVEQCIEPGPHWGPCSCAVLDASYAVDSAAPDAGDAASEAPDAGDADADGRRDAADG